MKRIVSVSLLCFGLVLPLSAQPHAFQATTADIATWNLAGFQPIPREKAEVFAEAIMDIDPEVIVLVEVNPDFIAAEITAELIEREVCYKRTLLEQTASQNIALLYKCSVSLSNPRLIEGSDAGNFRLRKALAADVQVGAFDFTLVAVHLKSGRSSSDRAVRDTQAEALATFIQNATAGSEKDILILGDYNMIPDQDQSNFTAMDPGDVLHFISDDLLGAFSHIGSSGTAGNLLDGFAIARTHTGEYIAGSLQILPLHDALDLSLLEYRNSVSDHLPLNAHFRITADDDGD